MKVEERVERLIAGRRFAYYVPETGYVKGYGYRVSVVVEGEIGHFPTGNWPFGKKKDDVLPWFWGPTLADARKAADEMNQALGISPKEAAFIVLRSMTFPFKEGA